MKIKRHTLPFSGFAGPHVLVDSYFVGCVLSRDSRTARARSITGKGGSWEADSAYPYSLISGLESLMVVRVPWTQATDGYENVPSDPVRSSLRGTDPS